MVLWRMESSIAKGEVNGIKREKRQEGRSEERGVNKGKQEAEVNVLHGQGKRQP